MKKLIAMLTYFCLLLSISGAFALEGEYNNTAEGSTELGMSVGTAFMAYIPDAATIDSSGYGTFDIEVQCLSVPAGYCYGVEVLYDGHLEATEEGRAEGYEYDLLLGTDNGPVIQRNHFAEIATASLESDVCETIHVCLQEAPKVTGYYEDIITFRIGMYEYCDNCGNAITANDTSLLGYNCATCNPCECGLTIDECEESLHITINGQKKAVAAGPTWQDWISVFNWYNFEVNTNGQVTYNHEVIHINGNAVLSTDEIIYDGEYFT